MNKYVLPLSSSLQKVWIANKIFFYLTYYCKYVTWCLTIPWHTQVLSLLPPFEGKSVLELGAGIGRFTGELAKKADQVLALDFIDSAIKKVIRSYLEKGSLDLPCKTWNDIFYLCNYKYFRSTYPCREVENNCKYFQSTYAIIKM